ncbi:MAG: hypothetical protein ABR611_02585 [Chthoniobacterales bacterium]
MNGNRVVIKISPRSSSDDLLRVDDAMLQVIDAIRLFEEAEKSLGESDPFDWRLEKASTASPFTVTALAEPTKPGTDISAHVRKVKSEVSHGLRSIIQRGVVPDWMSLEAAAPVQNFFHRNQNGIWNTEIDFDIDGDVLLIDRKTADAGASAIAARTAIDVSDLIEREAFGEIEGVMVAAGRYRNQPAIQIRTELYGFVWCTLSEALISKFGSAHSMEDIWKGESIGVQGNLSYAAGGKLARIAAHDIREMPIVPLIDLNSVLDPDFTSGLSPSEYLYQLHEGELA